MFNVNNAARAQQHIAASKYNPTKQDNKTNRQNKLKIVWRVRRASKKNTQEFLISQAKAAKSAVLECEGRIR